MEQLVGLGLVVGMQHLGVDLPEEPQSRVLWEDEHGSEEQADGRAAE